MFERYTEKARRVVFFARYEASHFGSPYIETEHLLLGLLREDKALAYRFLQKDSSAESIRRQIEENTTIRDWISTSVDLPLSNESKRVLAYAAEEAERLANKHIGTEHLLLGLLREERCFATQILNERGLRLNTVRDELRKPVDEQATEKKFRPRVEMVDSQGNVLSSMPWGPWVAIPRAGEFLVLKEGDSYSDFVVDKITYQYDGELQKVLIVLKRTKSDDEPAE